MYRCMCMPSKGPTSTTLLCWFRSSNHPMLGATGATWRVLCRHLDLRILATRDMRKMTILNSLRTTGNQRSIFRTFLGLQQALSMAQQILCCWNLWYTNLRTRNFQPVWVVHHLYSRRRCLQESFAWNQVFGLRNNFLHPQKQSLFQSLLPVLRRTDATVLSFCQMLVKLWVGYCDRQDPSFSTRRVIPCTTKHLSPQPGKLISWHFLTILIQRMRTLFWTSSWGGFVFGVHFFPCAVCFFHSFHFSARSFIVHLVTSFLTIFPFIFQ